MPTRHLARVGTAALLLGAVAFSTGCSGDDGGPSTSPLVMAPAEDENGDNQFGNVGERLDVPLRVIVTRDGQPAEAVEVQWVTTLGGAFAPGTSLTGADGSATAAPPTTSCRTTATPRPPRGRRPAILSSSASGS
jgi:hypothetical protein